MTLRQFETQVVGGIPYFVYPEVVVSRCKAVMLSAHLCSLGDCYSFAVELRHHSQCPRLFEGTVDPREHCRSDSNIREPYDVFTKNFAQALILQLPIQNIVYKGTRSQLRFGEVFEAKPDSPNELLPPGPYFLCGQNIHQAWRLHEDDLDAFVISVVPEQVKNPVR